MAASGCKWPKRAGSKWPQVAASGQAARVQALAANCSHLQQLEWSQVAAGFKEVSRVAATCHSSGCKWPQGTVGPQVAASGATGESGVMAASGGRKRAEVVASSRK